MKGETLAMLTQTGKGRGISLVMAYDKPLFEKVVHLGYTGLQLHEVSRISSNVLNYCC